MLGGRFCRKVIGRSFEQPVFCGGDIKTRIFRDGGKVKRQEICVRCGKVYHLDPEILKEKTA